MPTPKECAAYGRSLGALYANNMELLEGADGSCIMIEFTDALGASSKVIIPTVNGVSLALSLLKRAQDVFRLIPDDAAETSLRIQDAAMDMHRLKAAYISPTPTEEPGRMDLTCHLGIALLPLSIDVQAAQALLAELEEALPPAGA